MSETPETSRSTTHVEKPAYVPGPTNRLIQSIFWPVSVWPSFSHMEQHAADDYVERTTPILSTALGFWICAGGVFAIWLADQTGILVSGDVGGAHQSGRVFPHGWDTAFGMLSVFLVLLYVIGFWMFASREDDYPN